ncbi:hypothetical protein LNP74_26320 [Klebsiella pneumoniae subsp. pneumoniae]|nr:hypothetical protein [Klebsiella pneumoniae subsp. pneumoniae]
MLAIGYLGLSDPVYRLALLFYFTMVIYGLISAGGFGLLISSPCATQQQAFIGVFRLYDAGVLLSGYVSPVGKHAAVAAVISTWINPIRHFTDITSKFYLKDASLKIVGAPVAATGHSGHHRPQRRMRCSKGRLRISVIVRTKQRSVGFHSTPVASDLAFEICRVAALL